MVLPYQTERAPLELLAIIPPIVARLAVDMSGREPEAVLLQDRVQLTEDDARFDPRPSLGDIHLEHTVVVLGRVDLEPFADGLARLRRSAPRMVTGQRNS